MVRATKVAILLERVHGEDFCHQPETHKAKTLTLLDMFSEVELLFELYGVGDARVFCVSLGWGILTFESAAEAHVEVVVGIGAGFSFCIASSGEVGRVRTIHARGDAAPCTPSSPLIAAPRRRGGALYLARRGLEQVQKPKQWK